MEQAEKKGRIKTLQGVLRDRNIDAALITLSRDLFYYTGTAQPCLLLITPGDHRLLVKRAMDFVLRESFVDRDKILDKGGFPGAQRCLKDMGVRGGKLGLELDALSAEAYLRLVKLYAGYEPVDIARHVLGQRMQKDAGEIEDIEEACRIMDAGHYRTLETLRPGMTELQLAAEVEYAHRREGHEGILSMRNFDFHISRGPLSSGANLFQVSGFSNTVTGVGLSPAVPAGPSQRVIDRGDLVIIDIPTCHGGYHCDQTRTYFLGKPPAEVKDLFARLRDISDEVLGLLKEGVTAGELFTAAQTQAARLGVEEYFLGLAPRRGNFLGHGIGLDANEPPILFQGSDAPLKKNYVLTIEIHLTHPRLGVVKLEDMVLVGKRGCKVLSVTPRELFTVPA